MHIILYSFTDWQTIPNAHGACVFQLVIREASPPCLKLVYTSYGSESCNCWGGGLHYLSSCSLSYMHMCTTGKNPLGANENTYVCAVLGIYCSILVLFDQPAELPQWLSWLSARPELWSQIPISFRTAYIHVVFFHICICTCACTSALDVHLNLPAAF